MGDTYVDIAKDKGAIVKPNTPIIYAVKNEALKVIRDYVEQQMLKVLSWIETLVLSPKKKNSLIVIKIMNLRRFC